MANYGTHVSFQFRLTHKARQWLDIQVEFIESVWRRVCDGEEIEIFNGYLQRFDWEHGWGWVYKSSDENSVCFYSEGSANLEFMATLLQEYLKLWDPKGEIYFTWANTCDKPRIDSFMGGTVLVSAKSQVWIGAPEQMKIARERMLEGTY